MLRVLFSGTLRRVAGCVEAAVPLPTSRRLGDLSADLADRFPGVLGTSAEMQWRHGSSHVIVAVNGRVVSDADGIAADWPLHEGDEVTIAAPLGGGSSGQGG